MTLVPTLYSGSLPEDVESCLQALCAQGLIARTDAASVDIGLYSLHERAMCQAAVGQIRLLETAHDDVSAEAEVLIPQGMPLPFVKNAVRQAIRQWQQQQQVQHLQKTLTAQSQDFERLMDIGLALSAEQHHDDLLDAILRSARQFATCDAASIFLIDETEHGPELVFKLSQNDSVAFEFHEQRFPLSASSLAGYCALSEQILNFVDVYDLPEGAPYSFNRHFDDSVGYRTRSMLVIPMRTSNGQLIGVIQFINRKPCASLRLDSVAIAEAQTLAFDEPLVKLLETLASQAAVAIDNNRLIERINLLFEGFVRASVSAIEQRDPTTSGHSFRVADFTVALAEAATCTHHGCLACVSFNAAQLRELRYAALLHDFGKVGVREHVLVKAKKLSPEAWIRFHYRIALQQERVRNEFMQQRLEAFKANRFSSDLEQRLQQEEFAALQKLAQMKQAVELANEPSVLDEGTFEHLQFIRDQVFHDVDGQTKPLLEGTDFLALSVRRGSLTEDERREIESHVTHTIRFLSTIPWTPELKNVPCIAGAHHEKMDGSGYPHGMMGSDIPIGARMMAVCDIFDALTASDRPYKAAMPIERALDILHMEAKSGKIDADLVQLFSTLPLTEIVPSLTSSALA